MSAIQSQCWATSPSWYRTFRFLPRLSADDGMLFDLKIRPSKKSTPPIGRVTEGLLGRSSIHDAKMFLECNWRPRRTLVGFYIDPENRTACVPDEKVAGPRLLSNSGMNNPIRGYWQSEPTSNFADTSHNFANPTPCGNSRLGPLICYSNIRTRTPFERIAR